MLVRKDMDVSQYERLFNIELRNIIMQWNSEFGAVLHFTVTAGSSTISIAHALR
jgi:hypothetical protein